MRTGDLVGPFYARPFLNGRQVWRTLTAQSFTDAKEEAIHLPAALDAQSKGLTQLCAK